MKVVLTTLNAKYIHSSLALRYLKRYCRGSADIVVREFSINNGLLQVLGELYREQPDVLGFACYIWNAEQTFELARLLKKVLPETVVVAGGPEVSYDAAGILEANACIDYIIQGEGEAVLAGLLEALQNRSPQAVPGVCSRRDGRAEEGVPQVMSSLDDIPFPYGAEDMVSLKDKILYYESSRGCPFTCQYCLSGRAAGVRFLSRERVLADLAFFISHGVKQVKFVDRTFNARKDHYFPILKYLAAQDCLTNFHFEIAADILDDEVLAFLENAPAGRFQFEIGIQSTHEATLQEIKRTNNWPRIVANVGKLLSYGNIHLHLDLIAGLPYEDYRRFARSFNEVYALRPHMLQLGFLKLLKGSGLRQRAEDHGYVFMDAAPYEVLANRYITYGEIRRLKMLEEVFDQVYNTGRFAATLAWLERLFPDAFSLYEALAEFWESRNLQLSSHGGKALFGHLAEFCRKVRPAAVEACLEFLKFDALRLDSGNTRPEFLPWDGAEEAERKTAFWREAGRVRKYLPGFAFTSWRDLKKCYHIETFSYDIPGYLAGAGELSRQRTIVLFSYSGSSAADYQAIVPEDFRQGGQSCAIAPIRNI